MQLGLLGLFLSGPLLGVWIVKGNLSYSHTLGVLPLTDPLVFLQMLAAGHQPERNAVLGVVLVLVAYVLAGGRSYCAWVCPMNLVTDAAHGLRRRLGLPASARLSRQTRYWILAVVLVTAAVTGTIAWELLNPVTMLMRGLLFGAGLAWLVVLAVFLFDLFVMDRGWCGRLCPMGACFSVIGRVAIMRVAAVRREECNDCMDCYAVCPEPQVISLPLKGAARGAGPLIASPNCTNCGRCIDVCTKRVFRFTTRFSSHTHHQLAGMKP